LKEQRLNIGRIIRFVSLACFIALAIWALLPPLEEEDAAETNDAVESTSGERNVDYVLRFSPGMNYMPGSVPFGIGEPLKGLAEVIKDFEKRFPDTRVEVFASPITREYLVTQLSSGQAPDILNVNVEDVWVDIQKKWYIPLDTFLEAPNEFIREQGDPNAPGYEQWWDMFKYQAISRGKAAPDNLNYCLSYDMVETGIYYNKDVFRQLNLTVPETWVEFIAILKTIKETPVTLSGEKEQRKILPMVTHVEILTDWCHDLFFDQLYYNLLPGIDLIQDPIREGYLQGYLDDVELYFLFNKGFFTQRDPRYRQLFEIMYEMRSHCNQNIVAVDFTREFVTQRAAMLWNPCTLTYRLKADRSLGFDWEVFYLPSFTEETTPYTSNTPMCVIGGSAAQFEITSSAIKDTDPSLPFEERIATSTRLRRAIQLLQFMTVPEHYKRIVNEYECFLPNILGVEVLPALKPFEEILDRRYTTTKWAFSFDLKFYEILRRMLELFLNDGTDLDGFMQFQEDNIRAATTNLLIRKEVDVEALQRAWDDKAALRATMKGLPDGNEP
jgi:raffinose/stachyose/melibiose transport system substrate-binding protein